MSVPFAIRLDALERTRFLSRENTFCFRENTFFVQREHILCPERTHEPACKVILCCEFPRYEAGHGIVIGAPGLTRPAGEDQSAGGKDARAAIGNLV